MRYLIASAVLLAVCGIAIAAHTVTYKTYKCPSCNRVEKFNEQGAHVHYCPDHPKVEMKYDGEVTEEVK